MSIFNRNKIISPIDRRTKNNKYIKKLGITCYEELPLIEASNMVKVKDIDIICKRAIACLLSIQLACDISESKDYDESSKMFSGLLKEYNVENELLDKEKSLFNKKYSMQDAIDVAWTYETYWALVWSLGLIKDIKDSSNVCDCMKAIRLVGDCKNYEEFKSKCKLRGTEEILDMLDLYYRYHWACVDKRINPNTNIGSLNPEVVMERRRGLEWLVSEENDWNDISLDT